VAVGEWGGRETRRAGSGESLVPLLVTHERANEKRDGRKRAPPPPAAASEKLGKRYLGGKPARPESPRGRRYRRSVTCRFLFNLFCHVVADIIVILIFLLY
jgi:hypothetical protein